MNTIEKTYSPDHRMEQVKEIGTNLFLFQFVNWKDLQREPWTFDKNVIMLKNVTNGALPSEMSDSLTHTPF